MKIRYVPLILICFVLSSTAFAEEPTEAAENVTINYPFLSLINPMNQTYHASEVPLEYLTNGTSCWYSLDGNANVMLQDMDENNNTINQCKNSTVPIPYAGHHILRLYSNYNDEGTRGYEVQFMTLYEKNGKVSVSEEPTFNFNFLSYDECIDIMINGYDYDTKEINFSIKASNGINNGTVNPDDCKKIKLEIEDTKDMNALDITEYDKDNKEKSSEKKTKTDNKFSVWDNKDVSEFPLYYKIKLEDKDAYDFKIKAGTGTEVVQITNTTHFIVESDGNYKVKIESASSVMSNLWIWNGTAWSEDFAQGMVQIQCSNVGAGDCNFASTSDDDYCYIAEGNQTEQHKVKIICEDGSVANTPKPQLNWYFLDNMIKMSYINGTTNQSQLNFVYTGTVTERMAINDTTFDITTIGAVPDEVYFNTSVGLASGKGYELMGTGGNGSYVTYLWNESISDEYVIWFYTLNDRDYFQIGTNYAVNNYAITAMSYDIYMVFGHESGEGVSITYEDADLLFYEKWKDLNGIDVVTGIYDGKESFGDYFWINDTSGVCEWNITGRNITRNAVYTCNFASAPSRLYFYNSTNSTYNALDLLLISESGDLTTGAYHSYVCPSVNITNSSTCSYFIQVDGTKVTFWDNLTSTDTKWYRLSDIPISTLSSPITSPLNATTQGWVNLTFNKTITSTEAPIINCFIQFNNSGYRIPFPECNDFTLTKGFEPDNDLVLYMPMNEVGSNVIYDKSKYGNNGTFTNSATIGLWHFDEMSGTTTQDKSGYSNDGTITGAVYNSSGISGGALSFERDNSEQVTVSASASTQLNNNEFSVTGWIYPHSVNSVTGIISQNFGHVMGWGIYGTSTPVVRFNLLNDGCIKDLSGGSIGSWQFFALSWNNATGNITYCVDGSCSSSLSCNGAINTTADALYIGSRGSSNFFDGTMDEIGLYNKSLTMDEIQAIYTTGKARLYESQSGYYDSGLVFDGVDDYVSIPSTTYDLENGTTFSFWSKKAQEGNYVILGNSGAGNYRRLIFLSGSNLYFETDTDGDSCTSLTPIQDTNWHQYILVVNNYKCTFYEDGVNKTNDDTITFGGVTFDRISATATTNLFNGTLDDIKIYNRSLTSDEIYLDYINHPFSGFNTLDYYINATDYNSNLTSINYSVDYSAPAISYASPTPQNGHNQSYTHVYINVTWAETGSKNDTTYLDLDGVNETWETISTTYTSKGSDSTNFWVNLTLSDQAVHTYNVWINNSAGLWNSTGIRTITIDTTSPTGTLTSPTNTTVAAGQALTFDAWSFSGLQSCLYAINNGAGTTLTNCGNLTAGNIVGEAAGFNNLTVWINSSSGLALVLGVNYTLDTNVPTLAVQEPVNQTRSSRAQLNFTVSATSSGIDKIWYYINSGAKQTITGNQTTITTDAEGWNNLTLHANNTAGLLANVSVNYTIDYSAPTINYTAPTFVDNTTIGVNSVNITGYITESGSALDTIFIEVNYTNITIPTIYNPSYNFSGINDSVYNYKFYVNNSAGDWNWTDNRVIGIDTLPPFVTTINNTPYYVLPKEVKFQCNVTDYTSINNTLFNITYPDGSVYSYNMTTDDVTGIGPVGSNITVLYEVSINLTMAGDYDYTCTAEDNINHLYTSSSQRFQTANLTISTYITSINFTTEPTEWGSGELTGLTNSSTTGTTARLNVNITHYGSANFTYNISYKMSAWFGNWTSNTTAFNSTGSAMTTTLGADNLTWETENMVLNSSIITYADIVVDNAFNYTYGNVTGSYNRYMITPNHNTTGTMYTKVNLPSVEQFDPDSYYIRYWRCTGIVVPSVFGCTAWSSSTDVVTSNNGTNSAGSFDTNLKMYQINSTIQAISFQSNFSSPSLIEVAVLEIGTGGASPGGGAPSGPAYQPPTIGFELSAPTTNIKASLGIPSSFTYSVKNSGMYDNTFIPECVGEGNICSWINFINKEMLIPSKVTKSLSFDITIPPEARTGNYTFSITGDGVDKDLEYHIESTEAYEWLSLLLAININGVPFILIPLSTFIISTLLIYTFSRKSDRKLSALWGIITAFSGSGIAYILFLM